MVNAAEWVTSLNEKFAGRLGASDDQQALIIPAGELLAVLKVMKEEMGFDFLMDITAVDYPDRFEAVYHLMRLQDGEMVRVKAALDKEEPKIESAVDLWKSANVMERETWDLMGIVFTGHPDLKRILCPDDFAGHPLRKDFVVPAGVRQ